MDKFLNVEGGFDPSGLISTVIGTGFAMSEAKKQRQLAEEIAKLDLEQQKQLAERLQNVQGEVAIQQAYYEFMAVQNNNEMLNKLKNKRYTSYIILGSGIFVLALVVILLKNKKNG